MVNNPILLGGFTSQTTLKSSPFAKKDLIERYKLDNYMKFSMYTLITLLPY